MVKLLRVKRLLATSLLAAVATLSWADAVEIDGIYYNLVAKAKTAEVTSSPYKYTGDIIIPSSVLYDKIEYSVTNIGSAAFSRCSGLISITIPNSVTSIGSSAFSNCSGLKSVNIPNNVASIGGYTFYGCKALTSVTIPNSVTSIDNYAFYACSGLTSLFIGSGVTSVGDNAFYSCSGLTKVEFASIESLCKISFKNFYDNPLDYAHHLYINGNEVKNLVIPESVTSIGSYAFAGCSGLTSVTIPNSVTSIGEWAFYKCSGLTSVTIPESVTSIGSSTFRDCSGITSVTIPNSVKSIGMGAFSGCSRLTSIAIPNSVTSIGQDAFEYCSGLTSISIPNSVTSIGNYAFYGCSGLTSVNIPESVTSIEDYAFSRCFELTDLYCFAKSIPSLGTSVFKESYVEYATLHVPASSVNAYKTAEQWKEFGTIVGFDPTAVEEVKFNKNFSANDNAPIYDLMGRRLQQKPASGYYIQGGKKYFVK